MVVDKTIICALKRVGHGKIGKMHVWFPNIRTGMIRVCLVIIGV